MPCDILCELCNRKIASVTYAKVKEYVIANGEVCTICQRKTEKLEAMFEKKKERFTQRFEKLLVEAKQELSEAIKELAVGEQPDNS